MRSLSLIKGLSASASFLPAVVASKFADESCQKGLYVSLSPLSDDPWAQKFCSSIRQRTFTDVVTITITETTFSGAVATVTSTTLTTTTANTTATSTITATTTSITTSTTFTTTTSTSVSTETDTTFVSIISLGPPAKRSVGCQKTKAGSHRRPTAPVFHGRPSHQSPYDATPTSTYGDEIEYSPSNYQRPGAGAQGAYIKPFNYASPEYPWDGPSHEEYSEGNTAAYGYSTPTEYAPSIPTDEGYTSGYLIQLYHGLLSMPPASASQYCSCYQSTETFTTSTITITADTTVFTSGAVTDVVTSTISTTSTSVSTTTTTLTVSSTTEITSTNTVSTATTTTTTVTSTTIIPVSTDCTSLAPSYQAANGVVFNVQCNASYNGGNNVFATIPTENFRTCLDTCSTTPGCVAIDFDESTTNCSLLSFLQGGQDNAPGIDRAVVIS